MRLRTTLAVGLGTVALLPAVAGGQAPPPLGTPTPTPTPSPTPTPPPGPAAAKLSVGLEGVLRDGRRSLAIAGSSFRARGRLRPFVAGQHVVVRLYRGKRKVAMKRVAVKSAKNGKSGTFATTFKASGRRSLAVVAVHRATPEQRSARSRAARVRVVRPSAGPGARGPVVRLLQRGLDRLHYAVSLSGVYDDATSRAVMAYRKVNGMARTGTASPEVVRAVMRGRGAFKPRFKEAGRHVEADLSRQVLALVENGRVVRTYHTSSGTSATPTVIGSFRVYMKTPGVNNKGMLHSSYFIRGYAVHGYPSVPPFPASHGCLRVPNANARTIYDWLRIGDGVHVYP